MKMNSFPLDFKHCNSDKLAGVLGYPVKPFHIPIYMFIMRSESASKVKCSTHHRSQLSEQLVLAAAGGGGRVPDTRKQTETESIS